MSKYLRISLEVKSFASQPNAILILFQSLKSYKKQVPPIYKNAAVILHRLFLKFFKLEPHLPFSNSLSVRSVILSTKNGYSSRKVLHAGSSHFKSLSPNMSVWPSAQSWTQAPPFNSGVLWSKLLDVLLQISERNNRPSFLIRVK